LRRVSRNRVAQYKELERQLEEELGDEPSAALRALVRQIEKDTGLVAPAMAVPAPRPVAASPAAGDGPATVTFLLTDIEGSTRLFEQTGDGYRRAVQIHHDLLRREFARHGGREVKEAGDSFVVAFAGARNALACAVACQQALAAQTWPEATGALRVRMAVHSGDVEVQQGEYQGVTLHRASRMLTAAHGGQILISEATAALVRRDLPEDTRLLDLGVYRLRDVPTPEHLFQAQYPGMAAEAFPPLAAQAGAAAASLPLRFTRFFGREREITELSDLLLSPQVRLVTLSGPGGTGKTRLALEVAERLAEPLGGHVFFTSLADLSDPGLIADAVLEALRVPRSPERVPLEQVVEALKRQPSLLVLDNMEQLIEEGAGFVRDLLARVPDLTLLVTSRQLLGLSAEREFALSPLPSPVATAKRPRCFPCTRACNCSSTGRSRCCRTSR
jgi:class 3 adenylate cyclase